MNKKGILSEDQKYRLAARGEVLQERVERNHKSDSAGKEEDDVRNRYRRLYDQSSFGDCKQRLSLLGTDLEELGRYVGFERWPEDEPLPGWVETLDTLLTETRRSEPNCPSSISSEVPFAHALGPFVQYAANRSNIRTLRDDDHWTDEALEDAEEWLYRRLSTVVSQPLQVEFQLFKHQMNLETSGDSDSGSVAYSAFVEHLWSRGFSNVVQHYPLLGRFLATTIGQWTAYLSTLGDRLRSDYSAIERRFSSGRLGTVVKLQPGKGDVHNRGQTVTEIEFSEGTTIYYKPRSLLPDEFLRSVVDELSETDSPDEYLPETLIRDKYGWVAQIRTAPLQGTDPAEYFRRVGHLLCLFYVFAGTDIHFENLLAVGDRPMIVDSETIITRSRIKSALPDEKAEQRLLKQRVDDSVFRTELLPFDTVVECSVPESRSLDMDGLTRTTEVKTDRHRPHWTNVNTDNMEFSVEKVTFTPKSNYPVKDGDPVYPFEYVSAIISGFKNVYEDLRLRDPQRFLARLDVPLNELENRYIFRNTEAYSSAIFQLITPKCQKSGGESGLKLERLFPELQIVDRSSEEQMERIFAAERTSLLDVNVPRFTIDSRNLLFRGECLIENFFEQTNREFIEKRLMNLSINDKNLQCFYIEMALSDGEESDHDKGHPNIEVET